MMAFLWNTLFFIITISILVVVHEYGHFLVARFFGVKVERFSIGFGKILWKRLDKKGTEFALSLIPLGGYVKMLDERNQPVPKELSSQSYNSKTFLQKFLIIVAGPFTNILLAIILYSIVNMIGVPNLKPVIAKIDQHSILANYKQLENYQISKINHKKVDSWEDVILQLLNKSSNQKLDLELVEFNGNKQQQISLDISKLQINSENTDPLTKLGIKPKFPEFTNIISYVKTNSPAEKAGIQINDEILALNNQKMDWITLSKEIRKYGKQTIILTINRNSKILDIPVLVGEIKQQGFIGISTKINPESANLYTTVKYGLVEAITKASYKVKQLSILICKVVGKLIIGEYSLSSLSGPISIAKTAGETANYGLISFLSFLAIISVNLGIMNILPLPVLDGGHLLFLVIEKVIGKSISLKKQQLFYIIGFILLLFITLISIFNDLLR